MKHFLPLVVVTVFLTHFVAAQVASAQVASAQVASAQVASAQVASAQPAALTGEQILAKSAQTYLALQVYRGDCHVTSQLTMSIKGAPAQKSSQKAQASFDFKRDDHFAIQGLNSQGDGYSIDNRGAKTSLTTHFFGATKVETPENLEMAVAAMTGVGGRAPTVIPALLEGGHWGFPFYPASVVGLKGHVTFAGHDCFLVTQNTKAANSTSTSTFWIDSQSFLLRQMEEKQGEMKFSAAQLKQMPQMATFKILSSQWTFIFGIAAAGNGDWWQVLPDAP